MSFDRDGDAGTAEAIKDALAKIASGETSRAAEMIENAPPGPIETQWGPASAATPSAWSTSASERHQGPDGGVALPLPYTVDERSTYPSSRPTRSGATRRAPTPPS